MITRRLATMLTGRCTTGTGAAELRREVQRLVEAQRISRVGSYDFEIASNTNTWSDQLYRIYGREPQSFNASYDVFLEMLHPEDRAHVLATHQRAMQTLEPFQMEERVIWPDGQVRRLASWGEVVADPHGVPLRMIGICWDITEQRAVEDQLVHEALHDRLTGLPNRALMVDRLAQALHELPRQGGSSFVAVVFVDVDRFKVINDSLGHEAGDTVLIELGRVLGGLMRPGDTVARFGGDEFVVLCKGLGGVQEARAVAERLLRAASAPLLVGSAEVVLTASAGIALASSPDAQPGDLLRDADAAMYRAKRDGRARAVVFADDMRDEAVLRLATELELRRAIAEGTLALHYQPVVNLRSGALHGVEALVRWDHPTRGPLLPSDVIPVAEETGLIVPLGAWVLERACEQLVTWHRELGVTLTMAVNLSGVELRRPGFTEQVAHVLRRTGVPPGSLVLEITETVLMRDAPESLTVLAELKALGVLISVDDFGTGYSSLSYLKRFPVDTLKIDRSFVAGLGEDPEDLAIVRAVAALAASLGMSTVAEGVENDRQLGVLRELGCDAAQGFLLGRPCEEAELTALLRRGRPPVARRSTDDVASRSRRPA